jgi:hypothetical protein
MGNAEKIIAKNLLWAAPLAGAIAAVINSVLFFIGSSSGLIDSSILIPGANAPLTVVPVIASSIIPSIIAGLVLAGLNYFLSKPWRVFTIIAAVLLVVTFANPFMGIPGIPLGMGIWLNVMHVVVAGSVLYCFNRFTRTAN